MRRVLLALAVVACAAAGMAAQAHAVTWCGTDTSATDRLPEGVSAQQIHVIYAIPSDGADRFGALTGPIVSDVAAIDTWWRTQDSSRAPRFDLYPFANCPPGLGRLDLSRVQLPRESTWYTPLETRFGRLAIDLTGPPFAFGDPFKKYLVFYDGPVDQNRVCGISPVLPNSGGALAYSFIFLGSLCPADLGSGGLQAAAAAHELTHNLGALVSPGPPHPCQNDLGHPCDSDHDLMYPFLRYPLTELVLDAGRDDYYGHAGTWWDVQDSSWLAHVAAPQPALAVSLAGSTGTGHVSTDLPGISCPPACSIPWDEGSAVTLSAEPDEHVRFAGWSGPCTGVDACQVTMDAAKTVGARFALQVGLRVQVLRRPGASGSISSRPAGIACPSLCDDEFDKGTTVRLTAKAKKGSRFVSWSGACRGTAACTVVLDAAKTVRATFRRAT